MEPTARIEPAPRIAWTVGLAYGPILPLMLLALGVDYTRLTESADTVRTGIALPMALLTIALASLITWLGWWRPILWEQRPVPRWLLAVPVLMAVATYGALDVQHIAEKPVDYLAWAAFGTLCVGFCEESVYRGITVLGFRSRQPEWRVWLQGSLMFALIHAWNAIAGQSIEATTSQFVSTFVMGSLLYVCRRASGTILVPMVLHAAWDWTLFASAAPNHPPGASTPLVMGSVLGMLVLSVIGAKAMFKGTPATESAPAT